MIGSVEWLHVGFIGNCLRRRMNERRDDGEVRSNFRSETAVWQRTGNDGNGRSLNVQSAVVVCQVGQVDLPLFSFFFILLAKIYLFDSGCWPAAVVVTFRQVVAFVSLAIYSTRR